MANDSETTLGFSQQINFTPFIESNGNIWNFEKGCLDYTYQFQFESLWVKL